MSNNSKLFRLTIFVMLAILAGVLLAVGAFSANAETDCPNGSDCYPIRTKTQTQTATATSTKTPTLPEPTTTQPIILPSATATAPITPAPTDPVSPTRTPWAYRYFIPMFWNGGCSSWQQYCTGMYCEWICEQP